MKAVLLLLLLLATVVGAEDYMWLGRKQETMVFNQPNGFDDYTIRVPYGTFVVIVAQGRTPNTFLTTNLIGENDLEIYGEDVLVVGDKLKTGGIFIEVLARFSPLGFSISANPISCLKEMTLVSYDRAQDMLTDLDVLRKQHAFIVHMIRRYDIKTRLETRLETAIDVKDEQRHYFE